MIVLKKNLPNIFSIKDIQKSIYTFTPFFKEICQNQPFSLLKHVYLNSGQAKFQMLMAWLKAYRPILFRSFKFLLDCGENK